VESDGKPRALPERLKDTAWQDRAWHWPFSLAAGRGSAGGP